MRLCVADDVRVWPVHERGELVYRVELPHSHQFFRVGYREYFLMSLLDGQTSLPQACSLATARLGREAPTADEANTIVRWLLQNKIVHDVDEQALGQSRRSHRYPDRSTDHSGSSSVAGKPKTIGGLMGRFNPFWVPFSIPRVERWLAPLAIGLAPVLAPPAIWAGAVLILIALILFGCHHVEFVSESVELFDPRKWVWLGIGFVGLKAIHELGHAIACYRQGCRVNRGGVVFVLMAPLAFVDVTSCWRLESRWSRMWVSAAGMWVEAVIAAAAMIVWTIHDEPLSRSICQGVVMTAGVTTILFNANVLMRFDGYHILADWVDIPNLAGEGQASVGRFARRFFLGQSERRASGLIGWRQRFTQVYGIAAIVWKVLVCLTLSLAASVMFHGAGVVIAVIGGVLWLGVPAARLIGFMRTLKDRNPIQFFRGIVLGGATGLVSLAFVFWMPLPSLVCIPVISEFSPSTVVRVRASGFVDKIYVADQQQVLTGQPLLRLVNEELDQELRSLQIDQQRVEVLLRQAFSQSDEAEVLSLKQQAVAIEQQWQQVKRRHSDLLVRADRDGHVVAANLASLRGTYLSEGDTLMNIVGEGDLELIALLSPEHMGTLRPTCGEPIRIRTASRESFETRWKVIQPRASDRLPFPALAALNGGPLPTKHDRDASGDDGLRLVQPHFQGLLVTPRHPSIGHQAGIRFQAETLTAGYPLGLRIQFWFQEDWIGGK
ncbi:efflux RND transporter periplasmic adaptor subunit [Neorhodopirellula pilleata]|uniref:Peptidase family M50 n=1 Tax=Neorhodopirellula pilleata TaxID=2714738 RepID=A0A5C6AXE4_9BACT|nr:efflux RND transporter periplasmic adaptor subunit [Neorhodopirellula pilleata]TWU03829.1 Peptidase family M50 [Neorhodopirellula pilleata]